MAATRPVEGKGRPGRVRSRLAGWALAALACGLIGAAIATAQAPPPVPVEPGLPPEGAVVPPPPPPPAPANVAPGGREHAPAEPGVVVPAAALHGTPPPVESGEDAIVLSFEGADIREVVASLAGALGISYQIDPRVEGQVTIRTTGRIPRSELFPIFNQILRSIGVAAVKVGEIYNIMPIAEAKTRVLVSRAKLAEMSADDMFIIQLVEVKNLAAQEMGNLLQPFITPGGDVFPYPRANLLVITDLASNVDRLREMIQLLDRDSFKDLKARVFKIKNADIDDLAVELLAVLDTYGITGEAANERGVYAIPLVRLNSVAVLAFNEDSFRAVEYWMKLLDVPPDEESSRTVRVYNVQNAKAADLAQVLNELYGGGGGGGGGGGFGAQRGQPGGGGGAFGRAGAAGGGAGGGAGGFGGGRGGAGSSGLGGGRGGGGLGGGGLGGGGGLASASQTSGGVGRGSTGGSLGGGSSGSGGLGGGRGGRGAQPAGVLGGAPGGGVGGGGGASGFVLPGGEGPLSLFKEEVRIVADEIANAIVILATKRDYQQILTVLRELDVVPRQVVIEVLIAEVSLNKEMNFGLQSVLTNPGGLSTIPTGTPAPTPTTSGDALSSIAGIPAGINDALLKRVINIDSMGALTAIITDQSSFRIQLDALASAGRLKVLASPHILTADNREASIHIGTEIPILTSQSNIPGVNTVGGQTALVNNVQYRSTGVILRVLPQVNADGLVNLQVRQEVSDVDNNFQSTTGSPAFTTREAETTAVVQNGDSLLLGGIISETTSRGRSGVPYLMDLPVLGRLFRTDSDSVRRIELIILLTPKVIRNRGEAIQVTQEYKDRLWDVVDEIENTKGLRVPTTSEIYNRKRVRNRATTAEKPRDGVLPNRDADD